MDFLSSDLFKKPGQIKPVQISVENSSSTQAQNIKRFQEIEKEYETVNKKQRNDFLSYTPIQPFVRAKTTTLLASQTLPAHTKKDEDMDENKIKNDGKRQDASFHGGDRQNKQYHQKSYENKQNFGSGGQQRYHNQQATRFKEFQSKNMQSDDPRQNECWFCLKENHVEKHLVVSISEETYLALAKGGLVPEHVLILPIEHYSCGAILPPGVEKEVYRYKKALISCFKAQNKSVIIFERNLSPNGSSQHMHLQVIPISPEAILKAQDLIIEEGKKIGIEFEEVPRLAVLQWHIGPEPYVLFELNGKRLLHKIPRNTKHPAQFARQVVATLLEMPERTDWKVCTLEKDVEAQQAKQFREMFMPYDPNFVIPQDASKDVGQQ